MDWNGCECLIARLWTLRPSKSESQRGFPHNLKLRERQDCRRRFWIGEVHSKGDLALNPKARRFKPFEFFDHPGGSQGDGRSWREFASLVRRRGKRLLQERLDGSRTEDALVVVEQAVLAWLVLDARKLRDRKSSLFNAFEIFDQTRSSGRLGLPGQRVRGRAHNRWNHSCLSATMGSTRMARRAGR